MKTRIAVYARVSKDNGEQNPDTQLREIRDFIKRRPDWHVNPNDVFVDRISSKKARRPQLENMMQHARWHHFDVIVCWKYDRIARDAVELLTVVEQLRRLNVGFVSVTQNIDTTTPAGLLVVTVLAGVARNERDHLSERIRAGIARAKEQGTRSGRPIGRPANSTIAAAKVRKLYANLRSCRKVAAKFGISAMTVSRLVRQ